MKLITKIAAVSALALTAGLALAGCSSQADTVSHNLSQDADSFKITRSILVHNDVTNTDIWGIEGLCALGNDDTGNKKTIICKIGPDQYVKETVFLGDNVSILSVQTEPTSSDPYHYKLFVRPETIIPDLELQTSATP